MGKKGMGKITQNYLGRKWVKKDWGDGD